MMERSDLSVPNVSPEFSYVLFNLKIPMWNLNTVTYDTDLIKLPKQSMNEHVHRYFHKMVSERHSNRRQLFIDGSKYKG